MRYLSVCSGIEAASVAWHHLGWTPVGFSEIEPFPAAVLAHRFPHVPNFGDMTKYEQWPIQPGSIDVLVGGTPCQSFSVAGLRKGLEDPRGNLMLTYLAIAARLRPRWIVWENVPGVLSSNGGRDFGTFLGALGELGYGFAYRVLDAQYVRVGGWPRAVPQRRRRVFVVGRLLERGTGDGAAAAEVLALREGLQRHLEASGKTRKGAAADAEGGARGGCYWNGEQVAAALTRKDCDDRMPDKERLFAVLQPTAFRWQNERDGLQQDDAVAALRASAGTSGFHEMNHPVIAQPVAFTPGNLARGAGASPNAEVSQTLQSQQGRGATDQHPCVAFQQNQLGEVRCNTVAGTVNTNSNASGRNTPMVAIGGTAQPVAFPIDTQNMTEGHSSGGLGFGQSGDPSFTVTKGHSHAVAHAFYSTGGTHGVNQHPEVSPAVKVGSGLGIPSPPAVAHAETLPQQGYDAFHASTQETNAVATLRTLRSQIGEEAFAAWGLGILDSLQPQEVLRSRLHGIGVRCATFSRSWPIDCAISREEDRAAWAMQSVREAKGEGCPSLGWQLSQQLTTELGAYLSELPRPGAQTERFVRDLWLAGEGIGFLREALSAFQEARRPAHREGQPALHAMQVRRLTATECEFLQGFPRNWTLIPWRKKPAEECPDGPRYKALGNSMACNCMAWIGERIAAYEQRGRVDPTPAGTAGIAPAGDLNHEGDRHG